MFSFEHPGGASSWKSNDVLQVAGLKGVQKACFDECVFGLKSPLGSPMKKPTCMLTNCDAIYNAFHGKYC